MEKSFSEIRIKGNFTLVKGFLVGFLCARSSDAQYFFYHGTGTIRRDTVTGTLKQLMELDSEIRFCLESSELNEFKTAVEAAYPKIGLEIKKIRSIKDAHFECKCEVYNEDDGKVCKDIFSLARENVELLNFTEEEIIDKKAAQDSMHKAHPYTYKGKGTIKGDFGKVMDIFLKLKRSSFADFISCGEVSFYYN